MARLPVAERRARLLEAAFTVIARSGVSGATTRAVVEEAGMKLASFHYAFTSREELLAELVDAVLDTQQEVLDVDAAPGSPLGTVLHDGLIRYFDGVRRDPARERAMFELTQYALRTPGLAPVAERQYERYRELARRSLEEAATRSGARWRAPLDDVAGWLVALTDGVTLAWLADGDDTRALTTLSFAARALAAEAAPAPVRDSAAAAPAIGVAR
ncbi:TetR/AcrR family transcriptional regulator [Herbiconiux sp. KACC 21604]|uniref:TetR/AcrR family transcriptional regulator n=1 Tax=unclassified Herbiconiux TaxID=2618217 RepID=UPI0014919A81|nr:TetR/AcrR family transcriptional regulator [Herbiconiux sp. SALV-R1]QJU53991.1 TetR/AcrR family transcriptional regulator [Herbiconiux sp. SALV-R1]WPO85020.1 TetR/AcrR family transcriptional regulator [Herbiconiux sp. KACC 21604]